MSLLERFLQYSLRYQRPIRVLVLQDEKPRAMNIMVETTDETTSTCRTGPKGRNRLVLQRTDVLSAGYARGDRGDTLEKQAKEG